MKILFIPAIQRNLKLELSLKEIKKLPKKILLLYSIQYQDLAKAIKSQLLKANIKIPKTQQILGCSKIKTSIPILVISTGKFHSLNLYLQTPELYVLEGKTIRKIPQSDIQKLKTQRKTALIRFLSADNIGILISTKPGQKNLKKALRLKEKIEKKYKNKKKVFIFISNNIDINQFENFNIDSWVNTACSGLIIDKPTIINYSEIPKL